MEIEKYSLNILFEYLIFFCSVKMCLRRRHGGVTMMTCSGILPVQGEELWFLVEISIDQTDAPSRRQ